MGSSVKTISHGHFYGVRCQAPMDETSLAYAYRRQRLNDQNTKLGYLLLSFLFKRIKQRKRRDHIYMLRDESGIWLDD